MFTVKCMSGLSGAEMKATPGITGVNIYCGSRKIYLGGREEMRLKELRIKKNMKQQDVADFLECALSVYSRYEREERTCPLESIIKLSGLFEVSIECILDLPEPVAEGLSPEETELVRAFRQAED